MKIEEMIEKLRYKANNIKAHIEPEFFNEVADTLENQVEFNKVISILEKMKDTYRKLYEKRLEDYDKGFADGLEYALIELRGDDDEVLAWMPLPKPYIQSEADD